MERILRKVGGFWKFRLHQVPASEYKTMAFGFALTRSFSILLMLMRVPDEELSLSHDT
jgi:hypothetical protein